jgi:dimethylargininase
VGSEALRVRDSILLPSRFPQTREMLEAAGYRIVTVDNTELAKAESGLTCLSLLFEA